MINIFFSFFFQNLLTDEKVSNASGSETVCNKLKSSFVSLDEKAISPTPIKTVGTSTSSGDDAKKKFTPSSGIP